MILTALFHSKHLGKSYKPSTALVIGVFLTAIGYNLSMSNNFKSFLFLNRNLCFTTLHFIEKKSFFLVISFTMRIITSIGEASMLPSAIAVGK